MDKSSSATCLLYSDVVKGEPSPKYLRKYQEEDEEAVTKKAIKEFEIFVSQIFYKFFLFISFFFGSITLLNHFFNTFFTHDIYPHPHQRPTPTTRPLPTTHDPRPTTFSYTLHFHVNMEINFLCQTFEV